MKEVFIFFACFYIFQISQAQSVWAPIGATWYYQENYYTSADTGFALFSVDSDTTILGKTCSVIKGKHEFWYLPGNDSIAITYKKNDTVYIFDRYTNLFTPVFFYNTNPTDVWNVTWHNCSYNYFVDSVKLMNLNGFIHKVFYLFEQNNWIHYIVIEDIGCLSRGIFQSGNLFCDSITVEGSILTGLGCYQDSIHNLFWVTGLSPKCDYVSHVDESISERCSFVKIYPNPFETCFWIDPFNESVNIKIFNLQGQLMHENKVIDKTKICPKLKKGIYFISTQSNMQISLFKILIY